MRKRKKNVVYNLLNASKSAMLSAMEIHNKPQFSYRYPTVAMLFINAWELLLKAYIYKIISNKEIYENDDKKHTISFSKALVLVRDYINSKEGHNKFISQFENLELIDTYRNTNVHYFEEELDPAIFMLLSKSLLNYNEFLVDYFNVDLTEENNLIILPIGFKVPFNPVEFLNRDYNDNNNDFVSEIIKTIKYLNDEGIEESIIVGFDTLLASVKKVTNADIIAAIDAENEKSIPVTKAYRLTNDKNAPAVRSEDILPEYDYKSFTIELKKIIPNLKINKEFSNIYKMIKENPDYCTVRYLDPRNKTGAKKPYFTQGAVTKFCELYNKEN